jgi:1-deoxyxylulose-5-phosphate synthase
VRSRTLYRDSDRHVVDQVTALAAARGVPRAQVALAWVMDNPQIDAAIVGATKSVHLSDALAALQIELSAEETAQLESAYQPREFVS